MAILNVAEHLLQIFIEQMFEADDNIIVNFVSGFKLPFVKAHTVIKQQSDIGTDEAATVSVDSMV